jgi:hypothetical protein
LLLFGNTLRGLQKALVDYVFEQLPAGSDAFSVPEHSRLGIIETSQVAEPPNNFLEGFTGFCEVGSGVGEICMDAERRLQAQRDSLDSSLSFARLSGYPPPVPPRDVPHSAPFVVGSTQLSEGVECDPDHGRSNVPPVGWRSLGDDHRLRPSSGVANNLLALSLRSENPSMICAATLSPPALSRRNSQV